MPSLRKTKQNKQNKQKSTNRSVTLLSLDNSYITPKTTTTTTTTTK